jgi:hypothetical protein
MIKQIRILALLIIISSVISISSSVYAQKGKIAIFGSSVAKGSGDTTGVGGYSGHIINLLTSRGWTVVNVSKGGDNTIKIMPRFESQLLPEKPKYVILALSLGNEGIYSSSETVQNRNFERFRSGVQYLIRLCRDNGMYPIVSNCYARNDFELVHYEISKKMNILINTWDVPSINLLGTIDNGEGKWLDGFWHDKSHPDFKGHKEMFYAFVPSLFDAIESGKKVPCKVRSSKYLLVKNEKSQSPLSFTHEDTIHSFAVSFLVRSKDNGTIAAILGDKISSRIELSKGKIIYNAANGQKLAIDSSSGSKGWQYIVLSHQYASGKTSFFVNGKLAGTLTEKLLVRKFVIGGNGNIAGMTAAPVEAGYKDLLIFRSALNIDEAKALYYDQLLQSSLEIYAPLNDMVFKSGTEAINNAQSLSKLMIQGESLISKEN